MLSEQDKQEMLADAKDLKRRDAFRRAKAMQENRPVSPADYLMFLDQMRDIFPEICCKSGKLPGNKFRL